MDSLEFWPEYDGGPLWLRGTAVDLDSLPLAAALRERLKAWNAAYGDEKLPIDGDGDRNWLEEGRRLLGEVRQALENDVVVHEDWWGEPGLPFVQPPARPRKRWFRGGSR